MESAEPQKRDHGFHPLEVALIVDETHDARSIVFAVPAHLREAFRYQAGQFLTLEVPVGGVALRRCYSLASAPGEESGHKVTVKRVRDGRVSNWINDALKVGDVVAVQPPEGRFVLTATDAPLVMFAGGSGITPVISIVKAALATTARTARLLYANRDARSIIFRDELDRLARAYPGRLEVTHRLDDVDGFLAGGDVRGDLAAEHYVCGPAPFMEVVERSLAAVGVDPRRVHVERFLSLGDPGARAVTVAAAVATAAAADSVPAVIDVTLRGKRVAVAYTAGQSILQAALAAGLDAPYSCEEGFCGCCAAQLTQGKVDMAADDALTPEEKRRGLVLTCQSRPRTGVCAVEYLEM